MAFRFSLVIIWIFCLRLTREWIDSLALNHEAIVQKRVELIYLLLAIWLVIVPVAEEFGIKIDRSRQNRGK